MSAQLYHVHSLDAKVGNLRTIINQQENLIRSLERRIQELENWQKVVQGKNQQKETGQYTPPPNNIVGNGTYERYYTAEEVKRMITGEPNIEN